MMTFQQFMKKYAPSLWQDSYTFKLELLGTARRGWAQNGAQGLVNALRQGGWEDIARKIYKRYNGLCSTGMMRK